MSNCGAVNTISKGGIQVKRPVRGGSARKEREVPSNCGGPSLPVWKGTCSK